MAAGRILNPHSGKTVIDLCSAPGGKTTHLAELMENKGVIRAGDLNQSRLRLVEKAAERLGVDIIQTRVWDARDVHKLEKRPIMSYVMPPARDSVCLTASRI